MAGRRRKRSKTMRLSGETIRDNVRDSPRRRYENHSQFDLPDELWEQILSRLTLKDNIRSSAVSKRFFAIATSVQKVNKPPFLLYAPKRGYSYQLYDPYKRKFYDLDFPELRGARFCYSKDGWLLMFRPYSRKLFFFNPYTRETIKIPSLQFRHRVIVFSAAPTSPKCVLFSLYTSYDRVRIYTCRPGEEEWTVDSYQQQYPFVGNSTNKIVFSKDLFYCINSAGFVGVYNPEKSSWSVQSVVPPGYPDYDFGLSLWNCRFMAEHDGDIIVVYILPDEYPLIFKLDLSNNTWVEIKNLGGMTVFANILTSHVRTDILGNMQNNLCFSKVRFYGKRCVSYSLEKRRYLPLNQRDDWGEVDPYENIWIDAPEDISTLL